MIHTMDRDSVDCAEPSAAALRRSGAIMSDAGAVLLIFATFAVALTAIKPRFKA
jgi:hypothetical protein